MKERAPKRPVQSTWSLDKMDCKTISRLIKEHTFISLREYCEVNGFAYREVNKALVQYAGRYYYPRDGIKQIFDKIEQDIGRQIYFRPLEDQKVMYLVREPANNQCVKIEDYRGYGKTLVWNAKEGLITRISFRSVTKFGMVYARALLEPLFEAGLVKNGTGKKIICDDILPWQIAVFGKAYLELCEKYKREAGNGTGWAYK